MQQRLFFSFFILLLLFSMTGCGGKEFVCEPYTELKNYTLDGTEYQFTRNTEQISFAVIDKKCNLQKGNSAKYLFENYFTEKYANTINKAPGVIEDINQASSILISIIEEPLSDIQNDEIDKARNRFKSFMKTLPQVDATYRINVISGEFSNLRLYTISSMNDQLLSKEEMKLAQDKTVNFVYVTLEETNSLKKFAKDVIDSNAVDVFFWLDRLCKKFEWYQNQREKIIKKQIKKILFETPIDFAYVHMNG